MKNGPEIIVSCDIGLGERFNFVDLDTEEVSRFLSDFDIPLSQNPLSIIIQSKKNTASTKQQKILGLFHPKTDTIEIYPEEIQEWRDGKLEPVAEGTLLHELGHYVDAKVNPDVFQEDAENRRSVLKAEVRGLSKIYGRAKLLLGCASASYIAGIFVDKPVEIDAMLTVSSIGFTAMTFANYIKYNKAYEQFGQAVLRSYFKSRNEQFANDFAVDHFFAESGKLLRLEKKL